MRALGNCRHTRGWCLVRLSYPCFQVIVSLVTGSQPGRIPSQPSRSSRLGSPCDSCGQEQLRELSLWAADLQDQSGQRPSGIRPDGAGGGPCQSVPQTFVVDFFQSFLHGEFGVFNMMDLGSCILDLGGCIQR